MLCLTKQPAWLLYASFALFLFTSRDVVGADEGPGIFFETRIRPLLIEKCSECHGAEQQENGLRLDSREGLLKGGQMGAAIVPGQADQSLLIKAIKYQHEDIQMPPDGEQLSGPEILALVKWINDGATWPDSKAASTTPIEQIDEIRKTHWAFQPIERPQPPSLEGDWIQNDIDRFVLARLEKAGLVPSPRADRRTLIRRAYFDLLGFPPTYKEVEAFLADKSSDAWEVLIDRLLSRSEYGQRWGRHWLDVARYSDTKGYVNAVEIDPRYPFAWTYRDYVIQALNEDLPYDRFVKQQLAADQMDLPQADRWNLAAMGFLTVGRRFFNRRHHYIADRIDLVGRGLMGMTMMCAQCHDHKFDPISMKDYYALYGILDSSEEPSLTDLPAIGAPQSTDIGVARRFQKEYGKVLAEFRSKRRAMIKEELRDFASDYLALLVEEIPEHASAEKVSYKTERTLVRPSGIQQWQKFVTARLEDPVFLLWHRLSELPRDEFAERAPQVISGAEKANRLVREALEKAAPKTMKEAGRAIGTVLESVNTRWKKLQEIDPGDEGFSDPATEEIRLALFAKDAPAASMPYRLTRGWFLGTEPKSLKSIQDRLEKIVIKYIDVVPPRAMILEDGSQPHDCAIHIRGNHKRHGPIVKRRFLQVLKHLCELESIGEGSGRLQLARAIVHPDNPLTSRVMVNRIWGWHFGSHLVSTPSDFGTRSDPPSHPELLDYLARRFMDGGWSIKSMHRLIMQSATYQQQSIDRSECLEVDPLNRLYWRMNRRRLEFEPMRDAMLAVTGELDLKIGGLPFRDVESSRRSVYFYNNRRRIEAVLPTFDVPVPESTLPKRAKTTVPQQSLYLMNSGFSVRRARKLVDRLDDAVLSADPRQKIEQLYRWVYGRMPTSEEVEIGMGFVGNDLVDEPPEGDVKDTSWSYGYGRYDKETGKVVSFTEFPYFDGKRWQESAEVEEGDKSFAYLSETKGRPGRSADFSVIRRWTAPPDAGQLYLVKEPLSLADAVGDGVDVWIVSSRQGLLKHIPVDNRKPVNTRVEKIDVQSGDHIDLVVSCREHNTFDDFNWAPRLFEIGVTSAGSIYGIKEWRADDAFKRSILRWEGALTPWEQYAQVLMISNEFMFVD